MRANFYKNLQIRKQFFMHELITRKNIFLFFIFLNASSQLTTRLVNRFISYKNAKIGASRVKIRNKCTITGRNNSINSKYAISRIALRGLIGFGMLPGYKKAAW
jgi:ribosomal protein S14